MTCNENENKTLSEDAAVLRNSERTCDPSDTLLTQQSSSNVLGDLARLRKKHGANTPAGHTCSNLMEQLEVLPTYERPDWAEHPTQTPPFKIKEQMEALAANLSRSQ